MAVNSVHPAYSDWTDAWQRMRDVVGGDRTIRERSKAYLPVPPGRSDEEYLRYLERAYFTDFTSKTLIGLVSTLFRKPPVVNLPPDLEYIVDDADGRGVQLSQLAKYAASEILTTGRGGLLVDFPADPEIRTLADQRRLGGLGRLYVYKAEDVINWRFSRIGSDYQLTLLVLREQRLEPKENDEFESELKTHYRVLRLENEGYEVEIWSEVGGKYEVVEKASPTLSNGTRLDWIPFIFLGAEDLTDDIDKPPIYDIAAVNLAHYRNIADFEDALFMVGQPTPVITGLTDDYIERYGSKLVIGSRVAWPLPANSDAKLLELQRDLGVFEKAIERKESQMVNLGAKLLQAQQRAAEAAETMRLRQSGEASVLASVADNVSIAINTGLEWLAFWSGQDSEQVEFTLNRDFFSQRLTPQELAELVKSWHQGAISQMTLYENLLAGEIVSDGKTFEQYVEEIDNEKPALPAPEFGEEDDEEDESSDEEDESPEEEEDEDEDEGGD